MPMALQATVVDRGASQSSTTDPRDALRKSTAHLHASVDAGMPLSRIPVTLADYLEHLCLLRDWVQSLRALTLLGERLDAEAAALSADIQHCERLLQRSALPPRAPCEIQFNAAYGDAQSLAWGVAYVIEGSRLGGQMLYRRLAESLAPHPLDYLRGAGSQTGARWRDFLEALRVALDTPARVQAACEGAVLAFEQLLQLSRRAPIAPGHA